jgi:DNA repair protein RadA/Sms
MSHYRCVCCRISTCKAYRPARCQYCGAWNTLRRIKQPADFVVEPDDDEVENGESEAQVVRIADIDVPERFRYRAGILSVDKAFGSDTELGMVNGSTIMLSGAPGIGKSTLLTQIGNRLSRHGAFLYGCGEEIPDRITERAYRLQLLKTKKVRANFCALPGTSWEAFRQSIIELDAKTFIIDSISVFHTSEEEGAPGGVRQLRKLGKLVTKFCQDEKSPRLGILICHITKDGSAAGPMSVEHEVDVAAHMDFDNEALKTIKIQVRKNRFGVTTQAPILRMTSTGLKAVKPVVADDEGSRPVPYRSEFKNFTTTEKVDRAS